MEEEARWDDSSAEASMTVSPEPWRCPCGIPPESHHICSAGTCWWCLADRVKAQSDAEPVRWELRRPAAQELNEWIEKHFSGHGVAIRRQEDPPIPGEPFISMEAAKILTRKAVKDFAQSDAGLDAADPGRFGYSSSFAAKTSPAQSNAGPVAWRWRWRADPPNEWHFAVNEFHGEQIIIEPLYAAPPDASAGLIEAAELAEKQASEWAGSRSAESCNTLRLFAKELRLRIRSRAADRSGK